MNELQIFGNSQFGEIRVLEKGGEPWFVAADVCRALELANTTMTLDRLDEDEKSKFNLGLSGGDTWCVNEPGLYTLVLGSRKPEAKAFKRWITHDVIPSIRKTGGYNLPKDYPSALRALADAEEKRAALEAQFQKDRPKVLFADSVTASKNSILIGELAKLLKQNGVEMGQNWLFDWLRKNGYLIRRHGADYNMPTQRAMELELFEIKETSITHADGHTSISKTIKVTGKGQQYFVNAFLG